MLLGERFGVYGKTLLVLYRVINHYQSILSSDKPQQLAGR
jgi:hypothetical protein